MSIFGKKTGVKKVKKLSKKELKALQEKRERERAEELQRTFELYRFTPQMKGNLLSLPPLFMEAVFYFTGGRNETPMTVGEIAKIIYEKNHITLTNDQVESMLSDAMIMTRYPVSGASPKNCDIMEFGASMETAQERAAEMMNRNFKVIVTRDCYLKGENRFEDTKFVVRTDEGFKNLKAILDARDHQIVASSDYDFAMAHREGLLVGMHFDWLEAEKLFACYGDDEMLREKLAEKYGDADFVSFTDLSTLYSYGSRGKIGELSEKETLDRKKELARRSAQILEEMGKRVIRSLNPYRLIRFQMYEHYYLGPDFARKSIIETPNRIARELPDFDPYGEGIQSLIRAERDYEAKDPFMVLMKKMEDDKKSSRLKKNIS